jgi:hypothetical protein
VSEKIASKQAGAALAGLEQEGGEYDEEEEEYEDCAFNTVSHSSKSCGVAGLRDLCVQCAGGISWLSSVAGLNPIPIAPLLLLLPGWRR